MQLTEQVPSSVSLSMKETATALTETTHAHTIQSNDTNALTASKLVTLLYHAPLVLPHPDVMHRKVKARARKVARASSD